MRTAEAGRFRRTVNDQGQLQQARGAGGIKGRLVAWVLASPGREGAFAGRSVKALVNLFGKGRFEAISSALQGSREQSIDNLLNGVLRYGEDRLDADFNRQFSGTARALVQVKGEKFSAVNFEDMEHSIRELAGKQQQLRQAALDAVHSGRPTAGMQALTAAERGQVIKALSSGANALKRSNQTRSEKQLALDALAAACDTRESGNVGDVLEELSGLYRHLQAELDDHGEWDSSNKKYTGDNDDVRRYLQARQEQGKALQQQIRDLRDNYSKALQTLEPPPAPVQSTPVSRLPGAPDSADLATALKDVKQELGQAMDDYETLKKIGVSDTTRSNHERYVQTLGATLLELEQAHPPPANTLPGKVGNEAFDTLLLGAATAEDVLTAHNDVEQEHSRALADFELMKQAKVGEASAKNHLYYMQDLVSTVFELKSRLETISSPATAARSRRSSAPQTQARDAQAGRDAGRAVPGRPGTVPASRSAPAAGKPAPAQSRAELEQMLADAMQEHKRAASEYESMRKGKFSAAALQSQLFRMNEAAIRVSSLSARIDNTGKA